MVIATSKNAEISSMTRLELYKVFSCTHTKYTGVIVDPSTEEEVKIMDTFLKYVLDDEDMTYVRFKSKNLTRIRKREQAVIKIYSNYTDLLNSLKENPTYIGIMPKKQLVDEVKICEIK